MGNDSFSATVHWSRGSQDFAANRYSRAHEWRFDGGLVVPASSSPEIVPVPWSAPANVDPEEAFVASLSSCHMLWFLSLAQKRDVIVDDYVDRPIGSMTKNADGQLAITTVRLRPAARYWAGEAPPRDVLEALHEEAHRRCFIANSVRTDVVTEIVS